MIRGLYTASSAMFANLRRQELVANNLANLQTPGYKAEIGQASSFETVLVQQVRSGSAPIPLRLLRTLGVVASEQARSEDVTNQVVDLEARLRNEQRVEEELLELLESRVDADLSEILKLQSEIGRVRTNIERYIAQRDQLSRLVSLATILVIIRPDAIEPEKPKEASMWVDFKGSIKDSWQGGVAFLSNTIAGLVGLLVGGLVWWIALIAVWLMIRRYVRAMPEPAP